uniref:Uncharacterized protein n=1 Tax=Arundo donax TaxID=35708 RepID=A0A0A9CBV1_ARUDO
MIPSSTINLKDLSRTTLTGLHLERRTRLQEPLVVPGC